MYYTKSDLAYEMSVYEGEKLARPSGYAADISTFMKDQSEGRILMGRKAHGAPIQAYNPVFGEFLDRMKNQISEPSKRTLRTVHDLMEAAAQVYLIESDR